MPAASPATPLRQHSDQEHGIGPPDLGVARGDAAGHDASHDRRGQPLWRQLVMGTGHPTSEVGFLPSRSQ